MKRICSLIIIMILAIGVKCNVVNATLKKEIHVYDEKVLRSVASTVKTGIYDFSGSTIFIEKDMIIKNYSPIGNIRYPFKGKIEGNNHTISIKRIQSDRSDWAFVGCLGEGGAVKDIKIIAEIAGRNRVAGVVGYNKGIIENCKVEGRIYGQSEVGGIVGANEGKVYNCINNSLVAGDYSVGGIAGCSDFSKAGSKLIDCINVGKIYGYSFVATICGITNATEIDGCKNIGEAWYKRKQADEKYTETKAETAFMGRYMVKKSRPQ